MNAYRFRVPLKRKLTLKGNTMGYREGVLIERDGQWAEASPLPGFSSESIDDVIGALRAVPSSGLNQFPSLSFAFSALEEPTPRNLKVPINLLVTQDSADAIDRIDTFVRSNGRAIKLKVGRGQLSREIEFVKRVRDHLPEHVRLRLDANRAWQLEVAIEFVEALKDTKIEYIEEPLQDSNQLETLFSKTGVNYALDETIVESACLESWPNAAAMICKPTIQGGKSEIERLAATGKPVVFSSAFESGVGIARIMQLAATYSPEVPAGLGTLDWLSKDQLLRSPTFDDGLLCLETTEVDIHSLERIDR